MRFFQYIAPLSPILFSKNHSQPATISSSKPPAIESRIDRDEQVPDVSSSQFNKTWNQAKTLPRPQIASLNREALPSFNTFHNRSREVESPVLSPVISSPNLRSASRALVADLDVDMEPNEDNLMEIDFHDVPKTCAGKLSKRNTTNYESNLEETQTKPSHHRDISTPLKEVQERLAVADISLEEEPVENVADKNNDQQE